MRRLLKPFPTFGYWVGIFAAIYFWVAVSIDIYLNRTWWVFTASSFSALGDPGPNCSSAAAGLYWIYNDVVIFPTALLLMVFCAAMIAAARNKVQSTAYSFFFVAAIFLFLVGVYHGETPGPVACDPAYGVVSTPYPPSYHDFVSDWFFLQTALAFLILSLGLFVERRFTLSLGFLGLTLAAFAVVAIGDKVLSFSVAQNEATAIIAIDLAAILMYWARNPRREA